MILQALYDYYQHKSQDPDSDLAQPGFGWQRIAFILLLDRKGELIDIQDNHEQQGKKSVAGSRLVPQGVKKTSGIAANLLWDNAEYVLGLEMKGKPERAAKSHAAFVDRLRSDLPTDDEGVAAVLRFLDHLDLKELEQRFPDKWEALSQSTGNISFRLQGESDLVCQRPTVKKVINTAPQAGGKRKLFCPVSGESDQTARLHPAIKGVWGAQSSGANIVSFNAEAFESHGKTQSFNSSVGEQAAFAYTTALNHLLRKDSRQRLQVGDASTVFWAEMGTPLEDDFVALFGEPAKGDDPDSHTQKVRALYQAVDTGGYTEDDSTNRFYVLGLAPNASRLAVRFWEVATVRELSRRIVQHFDDLEIVRQYPSEPPYPSLWRLLVHIAVQGKTDNIPPNLGGEFMRAILTGEPYPQTLLQAAIRRNRAERDIDYYRAALIKAVLNRRNRTLKTMEEIKVALDLENRNTGYRLGRLFAVLEKIQQEAQGDINATIRDKFYGAASSSPLSVFSNLMKLKNHHLAKLDKPGRVSWFERLIGEIIEGLEEFPAQMALVEQGLFAIGYYHQRQDFFKGKKTEDSAQTQEKGE